MDVAWTGQSCEKARQRRGAKLEAKPTTKPKTLNTKSNEPTMYIKTQSGALDRRIVTGKVMHLIGKGFTVKVSSFRFAKTGKRQNS